MSARLRTAEELGAIAAFFDAQEAMEPGYISRLLIAEGRALLAHATAQDARIAKLEKRSGYVAGFDDASREKDALIAELEGDLRETDRRLRKAEHIAYGPSHDSR